MVSLPRDRSSYAFSNQRNPFVFLSEREIRRSDLKWANEARLDIGYQVFDDLSRFAFLPCRRVNVSQEAIGVDMKGKRSRVFLLRGACRSMGEVEAKLVVG
jgi:hypothetical protein